ncbi:endocuticle structural glycoprotein SgAbd-4-like [Prorops nasuta]|uniref:endocuticle structural glycoprotein SgAbd-4-like n=1 Tax=Prorops nasuta TaxID=863751 RepID=UPI0034CD0F1F
MTTILANMNTLTVVVLLVLGVQAAYSAPLEESSTVPIVAYSADGPNPDGSYSYSYETANGIHAQEEGHLLKSQDPKEKEDSIVVQGSYSYTADDGTPISVSYVADENGFQPKGDHLPVGPAIPPAILRALEYIAAHPEQDNLSK